MNSRTRILAPLLIGMLATLAALLAGDLLREGACLDADGVWQAARRACALPAGARTPRMATPFAYLATAPLAVLAAFFLWRIFTFFASGRAVHRSPRR